MVCTRRVACSPISASAFERLEAPHYVRHYAAVAVIVLFLLGIDAHYHLEHEVVGVNGDGLRIVAGGVAGEPGDLKGLVPGESHCGG